MLLSGSKKYSLSNIPHLEHSCHRSLSPHCGFEVQTCACVCIRFTLQISQDPGESKGHGDKEGIHCKLCCGCKLPDNVSDIRSVLLVRLHTGYEWWVHHWKLVDCEYKCRKEITIPCKAEDCKIVTARKKKPSVCVCECWIVFLKVFLGMILGSSTVEKTSANVQSFTTGRGAAYKIYSIIDQVRQGKTGSCASASGKIGHLSSCICVFFPPLSWQTPSITSFSNQGFKPDYISGDIEFKNIHFSYPSRPKIKVCFKKKRLTKKNQVFYRLNYLKMHCRYL